MAEAEKIEQEEIIEEVEQEEPEKKEPKKAKKVDLEDLMGEILTEEDAQQIKAKFKDLREEAKKYRLSKKDAEAKLRAVIGLSDDDELDDAKIEAFKKTQESIGKDNLEKANARLITAEIKSLDGYNHKLVERLLDKSSITIEEDGTVTGLQEAVEQLEKEFPEIKVSNKTPGANPPPAGQLTIEEEYEALKKKIIANPNDHFLKQQLFLVKEKMVN